MTDSVYCDEVEFSEIIGNNEDFKEVEVKINVNKQDILAIWNPGRSPEKDGIYVDSNKHLRFKNDAGRFVSMLKTSNCKLYSFDRHNIKLRSNWTSRC
ncbi:hypothetical protein FQB35_04760 [Crassaminicella thermophila]|uniref:Uncharacterized protein n=1 Tax=Crassaminicella thermophila TaxID=2599308 RepID=A0A5C0SFP0_CRATE|nr:hypothetical protein [Crassaminicella thermophila]QEK11729.1 hypothetical protein FQB35_04760 [Crassaminicella thermophila]